jgi:hypothetical protein
LFVASLFVGALLDQNARHVLDELLNKLDLSKSIGLIAGGGAFVFAAGYAIGTFTQFVLRVLFWFRPRHWGRFHEVALPEDSFLQIRKRLGLPPGAPDRSQDLFAGAVFDFDVLRKGHKGVHQWLFRRWNAFNIAANSISALALSFLAGHLTGIPWSLTWCLSVLTFAAVLFFVAVLAWLDTMRMMRFMVSLEANKPNDL